MLWIKHTTSWKGSKNEPAVINLMNALRNYWGKNTAINRIDTPAIEAWVKEMRETKANGTINRHLAILRKTPSGHTIITSLVRCLTLKH